MDNDIDRFKTIVDNLFESLEGFTNASKGEVNPNLFDAPATDLTTDKEEFAKRKALEELEHIRVAFLELQDKVRGLMLFNYMTSCFQQFADYASDLMEVIEDEIDETMLTPDSLKKYKSIKKLRAQILNNVYNRYKDK